MWLLATYQPTTFFSLRPSNITSSGGKTLLVPTPYAVKMALLDAAIRTQGVASAEINWMLLRNLNMAVRLPERAVVNNLFTRILKPTRTDNRDDDGDADEVGEGKGAYTRTIGYREYVHFDGSMALALEVRGEVVAKQLEVLLPQVNYFGKRGSFIQFIPPAQTVDELPRDFVLLQERPNEYHIDSQLQVLDDCDGKTSFEQVNVFTQEKVKRKQLLIIVPYRLRRSSRSFSDYERINL